MAKPDEKQGSKEEIIAWALDRCIVTAGMPVLLSAVFDAAIELAAQRAEKEIGSTRHEIAAAIRALKGNAQGAGDAQGKG